MNQIHEALISYIREATKEDDLGQKFCALTDELMVRMMFSNYRGSNNARGLRLTKFGLTVMQQYFKGYEVKMPEGEKLKPLHYLYLDKTASMPYYCDKDGFVIYDHHLGIKLKLADGHVSTLIEIESE